MTSHSLSIAELRGRLASAVRDIERGGEIVVTRRKRPVARLVPLGDGEARLRAAGLQPPRLEGLIPRVKPLRFRGGKSLTRTILEERE